MSVGSGVTVGFGLGVSVGPDVTVGFGLDVSAGTRVAIGSDVGETASPQAGATDASTNAVNANSQIPFLPRLSNIAASLIHFTEKNDRHTSSVSRLLLPKPSRRRVLAASANAPGAVGSVMITIAGRSFGNGYPIRVAHPIPADELEAVVISARAVSRLVTFMNEAAAVPATFTIPHSPDRFHNLLIDFLCRQY